MVWLLAWMVERIARKHASATFVENKYGHVQADSSTHLSSRSPRGTKGKRWPRPAATDGPATPTERPRAPRSPRRRYGRGDANKREELLEAAIYIQKPNGAGKGILIRVV